MIQSLWHYFLTGVIGGGCCLPAGVIVGLLLLCIAMEFAGPMVGVVVEWLWRSAGVYDASPEEESMGVNVGNVTPVWWEGGQKKHGLSVAQTSPLRHPPSAVVDKPAWDAMKAAAPQGKAAFRAAMPQHARTFYDNELLVTTAPPIDEQEDARLAYADPGTIW